MVINHFFRLKDSSEVCFSVHLSGFMGKWPKVIPIRAQRLKQKLRSRCYLWPDRVLGPVTIRKVRSAVFCCLRGKSMSLRHREGISRAMI